MTRCLVFDIETVPDQRIRGDADFLCELMDGIEAPSNYKDPVKIAAYRKDRLDSTIAKLALQPWGAQVVAIGYSDLDETGDPTVIVGTSEEAVLGEFLALLPDRRIVLAGQNIRRFDLPMLTVRFGVHRLMPPTWWPGDGRHWETTVDLMDITGGCGLDKLARAYGLPGKLGSALEVEQMSQDELVAYCAHDVRLTRTLVQIHRDRFQALRVGVTQHSQNPTRNVAIRN